MDQIREVLVYVLTRLGVSSACVCVRAYTNPLGCGENEEGKRKRRKEKTESSRSGQTEQKCGIDSALCRASTLARVCVCGSCSTKTGTLVDGQTCHGC